MTDHIIISGLYADTKRKAEKRVKWKILCLQWKTRFGQNTIIDWLIKKCIMAKIIYLSWNLQFTQNYYTYPETTTKKLNVVLPNLIRMEHIKISILNLIYYNVGQHQVLQLVYFYTIHTVNGGWSCRQWLSSFFEGQVCKITSVFLCNILSFYVISSPWTTCFFRIITFMFLL